MCLSLVGAPVGVVAQVEGECYERVFEWDYDGRHWIWNLSIPMALYEVYRGVPQSVRTKEGPRGYDYLTTTQDYYVGLLAQKLDDTARQMGYDDYGRAGFVLAFAQSIPYTSDLETSGYAEYPRFPIETLVDYGGDCEDTAILFASLLLIMGYSVVYINPPDHFAVGVLGDNWRGSSLVYPKDSNQTYFYCETTGVNFKIGQLPQEFTGQNVHIYPIEEARQFVPDVAVVLSGEVPRFARSEADLLGNSNATVIAPPAVPNPIAQPVLPFSFNLIGENPVLFVLIIFAIAASMVAAIMSIRRSGRRVQGADSSVVGTIGVESDLEGEKFCIYCGVVNRGCAVFCESCGQPFG